MNGSVFLARTVWSAAIGLSVEKLAYLPLSFAQASGTGFPGALITNEYISINNVARRADHFAAKHTWKRIW